MRAWSSKAPVISRQGLVPPEVPAAQVLTVEPGPQPPQMVLGFLPGLRGTFPLGSLEEPRSTLGAEARCRCQGWIWVELQEGGQARQRTGPWADLLKSKKWLALRTQDEKEPQLQQAGTTSTHLLRA